MPVFLFLLGVVTAVAGLVLVASGLPFRGGAFDAEILTPGTIVTVGGLLLVGLGLAVRELRRIEQVLLLRPLPRAPRTGEAATAAPADAPDASVRLPFPSRPTTDPKPLSSGAADVAATGEQAAPERVRVRFPSITRREDPPVVGGADASPTPQTTARAEEDVAEVKSAAAVGRAANGGSVPGRVVPRPRLRPTADKANGSGPKVFWPVGPGSDGQATAGQPAAAAPQPVVDPAPVEEAPEPSASSPCAAPVTVLKSGVVEGMAYTLYSDGSIEAQLPQGKLRFGSISALRDHIEGSS
jgi:hypothetical protein